MSSLKKTMVFVATLAAMLFRIPAAQAAVPPGVWNILPAPPCASPGVTFFPSVNGTGNNVAWSPATRTGYVVGSCREDPQYYKYLPVIYKVAEGVVTTANAYNNPNYPGNILLAVNMDPNSGYVCAAGYLSSTTGPWQVNAQCSSDGVNFQPIDCPSPGTNQNIAYGVHVFSPTNVLFIGTYDNVGSGVALAPKTYLARSNGTSCTLISSPNPNPKGDEWFGVGASSPRDIWLVGLQGNSNGYTPLAQHFNEAKLTFTEYTIPTGPASYAGEQLLSVSVRADGEALADGYSTGGYAGYAALNDYFNGASWSYEYPEPLEGRWSNVYRDYGVSYVNKYFGWSVGENQGLCQMGFWDGTQWNVFQCPSFQNNQTVTNYFTGVDAGGDTHSALAGGWWNPSGNHPRVWIAQYTGN